ncbi:MAG: CRISPR-associated endonuclease Cas2 [Oscillospiraceae bacterium]
MVVVSYDVDTMTPAGAKRLRKVAKICESRGCRVQNSVFEVLVDPAQLVELQAQLDSVIDANKDSIRIYRLGSNWKPRITCMGKPLRFEQEDVLLL